MSFTVLKDFITNNQNLNITELRNEINKNNLNDSILTFKDYFKLDKIKKKGGNFWASAFNYPKENQIVRIDLKNYIAKNVGIFTMELEHMNYLLQ